MTRMASRPSHRIKPGQLWRSAWRQTWHNGAVLLTALLLTLLFFRASASPLFEVRQVTVQGNHYLTDEEIVAQVQHDSVNLFVIDADEVAQKLLQSPWINEARVSLRPPHALLVEVREAEPVLLSRHESSWQIYSCTGEVLPWRTFTRPLVLPTLQLLDEVSLSEACEMLNHVRRYYPELYSLLRQVNCGTQIGLTIGQQEVEALLCREQLDHQLTKLELFLDRPEMTNGNVAQIDLRFQNKLITRRRTDT